MINIQVKIAKFVIVYFLFIGNNSFGQKGSTPPPLSKLPDNFMIDNFLEIYSNDSIRVYFDCSGIPATMECASYYRVGKIDPEYLNVTGLFHDYFTNDQLCFKATMINGALEGNASYYYPDGALKEQGAYQKNLRQGKWTFYYPNGRIEKVYMYKDNLPLILEAFSPDGEQMVKDGNGFFKTEFSRYHDCERFKTEGLLVGGRQQGPWTFSNVGAPAPISHEIYEKGVYVKTRERNSESFASPNIGLSVFHGNENLRLELNRQICRSYHIESGKTPFNLTGYLEQLQKKLNKFSSPVKNQWIIVGLTIGLKNDLLNLNISSSINDTVLENYIYKTIQQTKKLRTSYIDNRKIEATFFFSIFTDSNKILIPENLRHQAFKASLK